MGTRLSEETILRPKPMVGTLLQTPLPGLERIAVTVVFVSALLLLGMSYFNRMERKFADVI
jgi:hypothetical protein